MPHHAHLQYVSANPGTGNVARADFDGDAGTYSTYNQGCNTGGVGGGAAHNNMPPYLTVIMWKRIA
jgi:microcystin-dependent protein